MMRNDLRSRKVPAIAVALTTVVGACIVWAMTVAAATPIRVLIVDGESGGPYHDWQRVTPALRKMLDETSLFDVTVISAPVPEPAAGPAAVSPQFAPDFAKHQVVVLNYDAPDGRWSSETRAAFERFVQNGGGVVAVHAADNAFPGWPAFNEMIGVGGWRNRTEQAGPYWFFRDGKLVSDSTPGRAGSHGKRVPFAITTREPNHPIMRGLPPVWMHQGDELYARMRGPGKNMTVLATAFSDAANAGSGRDEPQLMVLSYGKGRIFHTTLGHDINALSSVGFIATFQRGTEWAATGAVTQKVPANFPTANTVSYRADIAAMDPRFANGLDPLTAAPAPRK